jgi:predicted site-specific integrase-resolvase
MSQRPVSSGYLTKKQAAAKLGVSPKTLERRIKQEGILADAIKKGQEWLYPESSVQAHFAACKRRGYI